MDKQSFLPLSGFRDQLEPTQSALVDVLKRMFQSFGYRELETPIVERQEILLGKLGDEAQKLLYLFEDNGGRKVGLRYDLTVPLSRFVAANLNELPLPFKRFEIGPVFRAEKPQAGRYRQFTQADIDIIGSEVGEEELLGIAAVVIKTSDRDITVLINDRQIVAAVFEKIGIKEDLKLPLLRLLDKKDKITAEKLSGALDELGLTGTEKKNINDLFLSLDESPASVKTLLGDFPPIQRLEQVIKAGEKLGLKMKFDLAMVRGLDYYTGIIIECVDANYGGGSLIAGGRYDSLIEGLTGQKLPAVGISFGVDRLSEVYGDQKVLPLFIVCLPETEMEVRQWADNLRAVQDQKVEAYLDSSVELGKQIKYADKRGYKSILIPFSEDWQRGAVIVKNLKTGEQKSVERTHYENN